jgi:hypothetical protein
MQGLGKDLVNEMLGARPSRQSRRFRESCTPIKSDLHLANFAGFSGGEDLPSNLGVEVLVNNLSNTRCCQVGSTCVMVNPRNCERGFVPRLEVPFREIMVSER